MPTTIPALLTGLVREDPARPLVTFYDDETDERIELSVVTFVNWVNKTASLLQDEFDLEKGDLVLVDLPTHWLGPVWLAAAWMGGYVVTFDAQHVDEAAVVVCGPDGVASAADLAPYKPVVALSLRPLGARFAKALPTGVVDYGAVVLAQPDAFVSDDPPVADDPALRERPTSHAELLSRAAAHGVEPGARVLTEVNPCTADGVELFVALLAARGSVVMVRNPDPERRPARLESERASGTAVGPGLAEG